MGEIQELKQNIGQAAEQIITGGIPLQRKGKKYRCINPSAHKNGDHIPSMAWDPKALQFYCFTCNEKLDIYRYYREFEHMSHAEVMDRFRITDSCKSSHQESKMKFTFFPLNDNQTQYLQSRGLNEETIQYFRLANLEGNIAIPYTDHGMITGVKIKNKNSSSSKYFSVSGSNFGLLNKQNIKGRSKLIICEGEFDCMIVHQCQYENVVSVGTGANSLSELFKHERQFINGFNSLILLADNDEAGLNMMRVFLKEFSYKVKLPDQNQFKDCKDINEVYLKYGPDQISKIITSATAKIEGLRNLDKEPYKGVNDSSGRYIPTGLPTIDYAINDLAPGLVTLVTGRSNGGKSTFVNQIMANAIDKENKVLLVAGEGLQELLINNLYRAVIGRDETLFEYVKVNKRFFKEPRPEILKALQKWHKGKITLFNKGESNLKTTEELFEILSLETRTERPNLLVIDNLMSVLSVEKATEKLERQADFMQRCCDLAKSEKIHIILVLHPNKTATKNSSMDFDQISGTQDLANKADNIILVRRHYAQEVLDIGVDGEIEVLKNRYFSDLPKVQTAFDEDSGMLLEINDFTGDRLSYSFHWRQHLEG